MWLGTSDRTPVDQSFSPTKPQVQRYQETLVIDSATSRASLRSEGSNSDGSPSTWRYTILGDTGSSLKVKTGGVTPMSSTVAAQTLERIRWRIPQLALRTRFRSATVSTEVSSVPPRNT